MRLRPLLPLLAPRRLCHGPGGTWEVTGATGSAGGALQVLSKESEDVPSFQLDVQGLQQVFCNSQVAELPACVVSVAGAMRTGKSFLLDQMVRSATGRPGFSWRGGMARHTGGLHIYPEPLVVERGGEKLAVYLMDTQGTFDHRTTVRENMTVFALSTMTSSVLVYNVQHGIREDHLQHLQLFTEYGRLALKHSGAAPFQKLQFLVRDWHYPFDAPFGQEGGRVVLDRLLASDDQQPPEVRALREHIASCFTDLACWLLPYPGPRVAEDPAFTGMAADMDPRFAQHLNAFVNATLHPDNLEPKMVGGKVVKSREMVDFFQRYLDIFNGDEVPEPKSIFNTTAEVTNLHALNSARDAYMERMEEVKSGADRALVDKELVAQHQGIMQHSIKLFQEQSKFGGDEFAKHYQDQLEKEIQEKFDSLQRLNNSKIQTIYYQAKEGYLTSMEAGLVEAPLHQQVLVDLHLGAAKQAAGLFHREAPDGRQLALSQALLDTLLGELEARLVHYQGVNESRVRLAVYRAVDGALERYSARVEEIMDGPLSVSPTKLKEEHTEAKLIAMDTFSKSSSYGTNFVTTNSKSLEQDIEEKFAYYRELNASKRLGKRLMVTMEQLSDNRTYRQFWRSKDQQRMVGGGIVLLLVIRMVAGS